MYIVVRGNIESKDQLLTCSGWDKDCMKYQELQTNLRATPTLCICLQLLHILAIGDGYFPRMLLV